MIVFASVFATVAGTLPGTAEDLVAVAALGDLTNAPAMYVNDFDSTIETVSASERKALILKD